MNKSGYYVFQVDDVPNDGYYEPLILFYLRDLDEYEFCPAPYYDILCNLLIEHDIEFDIITRFDIDVKELEKYESLNIKRIGEKL